MPLNQQGDASIAAHHQPALVLDYARSRDLAAAPLLKGTGLDGGALPSAESQVSAAQYLQLLANVARGLDSADTSFMLGQQMLPGHYGAASHALLQAQNLRQALTILCDFHALLCPLLQPRLREAGEHARAVLGRCVRRAEPAAFSGGDAHDGAGGHVPLAGRRGACRGASASTARGPVTWSSMKCTWARRCVSIARSTPC